MYWSPDGTTWNKISDHNRQPLDISYERIGSDKRTVSGTLRRYSVAKKQSISISWTDLPNKVTQSYGGKTGMGTLDAGWAGDDIESFYYANDGIFYLKLRAGTDESKSANDATIKTMTVMFTDFSKTITKRGIVDFYDISLTLEEV